MSAKCPQRKVPTKSNHDISIEHIDQKQKVQERPEKSLTFFRFSGELLFEVIEEVGVEILTTKVSVTSSGLDSEDTALDVQERNIESTTTEIVDKDVTFLVGLSRTQTVGNSGGSGLVNDTENVQASNGTGVLGGLTLVVVEVSGDGDDGLGDLLAELGLSNLLHLGENHGGDLLGGEGLGLVQVLNLDHGVSTLVDDLEGPRLNILLDDGVFESSSDKTPWIILALLHG